MVDAATGEQSLLGRVGEVAVLDQALDGVASGRRGLVLVVGEAGAGKTSLIRQVLACRRTTTVWAAGDEAEADVDHALIDQMVRVAPLTDDQRTALLSAEGGDPIRMGSAIVTLLDGLHIDRDRPLVVVVDDAQWVDGPSLQALTFAFRRLRRDPVLLCVVVRDDGVGGLPSGLIQLVRDEGARITLGPLDRAAVHALVERELGVSVPSGVADRLKSHTGGNPLHLRTLLAELSPEQVLGGNELPAPRPYAALVVGALGRCAEPTRALVAAAAVLGDAAIPAATAAAVARVADVGPAVDEGVARGLLVAAADATEAHSLQLAHPLVRAAILGSLPLGRRAELHQRAGTVTAGLTSLRHRLRGSLGGDIALWEEARAIADAEARRGAHGGAAGLLMAATAVAVGEAARQETLTEAVEQLLLAGRLDDARTLRPQLDTADPSPRKNYVLGRLAYVLGPRKEARGHLQAAWAELTAGVGLDAAASPAVRSLAGRVAATLATIGVDRADADRALEWGRAALDLDVVQASAASTAHMLAGAWALSGRFEEGLADLDERCAAARRWSGEGGDRIVADACGARGLLRLWTHDLAGAADDLEATLALSAGSGSLVGRESARAYLAEVRYRQGRWDEAIVLAELSSSIVDDTDQVWMAALPHCTAARPKAARGIAVDLHLERATAAAELVGGGIANGLVLVARVEVGAARRDDEAVIAAGEALLGLGGPVDERIAPWRASFAEALVARGRVDEAAVLAADLASGAATPLGRNDAARALVVVAAVRNGDAALDAAAAAGLDEDAGAVGAYPRARLELAVGRAWRRRGERRRAASLLETALDRFRSLDAVPWAVQVEQELQASGLRPTRRRASEGHDLTPQERVVAHLVAQGLTNREVAAELVVSAKTIEHHLSRVYAKVGVRSRTELARRLRPEA